MVETEKPAGSPLGIIVGIGAAGLLLGLLLFRSSPKAELSIEQSRLASSLVSNMMTNGVLVDYDCNKTSAWVNRPVWNNYSAEQKRNMAVALATVCETVHHAGYRISIIDYDAKREIASFDGTSMSLDK